MNRSDHLTSSFTESVSGPVLKTLLFSFYRCGSNKSISSTNSSRIASLLVFSDVEHDFKGSKRVHGTYMRDLFNSHVDAYMLVKAHGRMDGPYNQERVGSSWNYWRRHEFHISIAITLVARYIICLVNFPVKTCE